MPNPVPPMSELTNYLKEQKEKIEKSNNWDIYDKCHSNWMILAFKMVLSKIEEVERNEFEKMVQVNHKS